jgi:hypothetical protein
MTLQDISHKYRISDNYLSSKEDALIVTAASLADLVEELQPIGGTTSVTEKMERLIEFLKDVKNSTF